MIDINDGIYNLLQHNNAYISVKNFKNYLVFIKLAIAYLLTNDVNYIYISCDDNVKQLYQKVIDAHPRLFYINLKLIPVIALDSTKRAIYIYTMAKKLSIDVNMRNLFNIYLKSISNASYLFVEPDYLSIGNYLFYNYFKYYLYFNDVKRNQIYAHFGTSQSTARKYCSLMYTCYKKQNKSIRDTKIPLQIYDYFVLQNISNYNDTNIIKYNCRNYVPVKSKTGKLNSKQAYTNQNLRLPDGTNINFCELTTNYTASEDLDANELYISNNYHDSDFETDLIQI